MSAETAIATLIDAASLKFRVAGPYAYYFARGKLTGDPFYEHLLAHGLLQGRNRILDLGCGQGLLAAWLREVRTLHESGDWPAGWPAPPLPQSIAGIDLEARDIRRAQLALGGYAQFAAGDLREAAIAQSDAIVIMDVLHYVDSAAQQRILQRIRAALPDDGLLLLRVGDADGGLRSRISRCVDQCLLLLRNGALHGLHRRPLRDWQSLLAVTGFRCAPVPMKSAAPFADVLLDCRPV